MEVAAESIWQENSEFNPQFALAAVVPEDRIRRFCSRSKPGIRPGKHSASAVVASTTGQSMAGRNGSAVETKNRAARGGCEELANPPASC